MTISLAIKVHDGLVLASDSATTLVGSVGSGPARAINVYNNANKIFNICKGFPIGGMTWDAGSIGSASISTLVKDARLRFSGGDNAHIDWTLDRDSFSIEQVAIKLRAFLFEEHYQAAYAELPPEQRPTFGFFVAGYSAGKSLAEGWTIKIGPGGVCAAPYQTVSFDGAAAYWEGDTEVVHRILLGHGLTAGAALEQLGVNTALVPPMLAGIEHLTRVHLITPPMPIQDVIDLAEWLVHSAAMFARFRPGSPGVGGPIEIAAITKHEGFKWVKRKHYFNAELNRDILR